MHKTYFCFFDGPCFWQPAAPTKPRSLLRLLTSHKLAETAATLDPAEGIDWFEGSVDEAFAEAKATDKPIYLYWGAVWCPPCYAISATVFKSPEFLERSKLFVPVYLDGDTERRAGVW